MGDGFLFSCNDFIGVVCLGVFNLLRMWGFGVL